MISYLVLFPLGESLREISSATAVAATLVFYTVDYNSSNLKKLKLKSFLAASLLVIAFGAIHSIDLQHSIKSLSKVSYDSLLLFLPGLEFCRKRKDVKLLIGAFTLVLLYLGLDGLYQYATDRDFFFSIPRGIYLSATMRDPHLGTMVAISLPVTFGLFYLMPERWNFALKLFLYAALTFPAGFFLLESGRRIGWVAIGFAALIYVSVRFGWLSCLPVLAGLLSLPFLGLSRFSLPALLKDDRLPVWNTALKLIPHNWLFGTGLDTFKQAQLKYNLSVFWDWKPYEHIDCTHNIYLGFIVDTGLIGFIVLSAVFVGYPVYMYFRIREIRRTNEGCAYVMLSFLSAFAAFLVAGAAGLNFYKPYMMASPMIILGSGLGLSVQNGSFFGKEK